MPGLPSAAAPHRLPGLFGRPAGNCLGHVVARQATRVAACRPCLALCQRDPAPPGQPLPRLHPNSRPPIPNPTLLCSSNRGEIVAFLRWALGQEDTWAVTYTQVRRRTPSRLRCRRCAAPAVPTPLRCLASTRLLCGTSWLGCGGRLRCRPLAGIAGMQRLLAAACWPWLAAAD